MVIAMSTEQACGFFRAAYSDKTIQGKLHHALAVVSPEVVAQIARASGYEVDAEDVEAATGGSETTRDLKNRQDVIGEYVMARDFWDEFRKSVVWKAVEKELGMFNPFMEAAPFRMTIPGPGWVQVMGGERESTSEEKSRPSAVELYDNL